MVKSKYQITTPKQRKIAKLLQTVTNAAFVLLAVEDNANYNNALLKSMEMIGHCLDADRVQLWRSELYSDGLSIEVYHQWQSEYGRTIPQYDLDSKVPYGTLPKWETMVSSGEYFNGPVSQLPIEEQQFLNARDTLKSIVVIPIFLKGQFWGFFCISDCKKERTLSVEEVDVLRSASLMVASAHSRVEQTAIEIEREAREMNQIFFDTSPFIMNIWDETPNLISTSQQAVKMFGLASQAQYLERFAELSPEFQPCGAHSGEKAIGFVKQTFQDGYAQFEWMHQNLKGEPIPTEVTLVRFSRKNKFLVAAYTVDLRPIKAAQERENEAHELNKTLLNASPITIKLWDENYKLFDINDKGLGMIGVEAKEKYIEDYKTMWPKYQPCGTPSEEKATECFNKAFRDGIHKYEWMNKSKDGLPLPLEVTTVRIKYKGKNALVSYAVDLRDIRATQERERQLAIKLRENEVIARIEIAEASSAAKSKFLARMSHEIRTPITAVMGISEIRLQSPDLPPIIEESFAKIHNSANILLSIINDILDLSKIEAGKMVLLCEEYNVAHMISDVSHLHLAYVGNKDIDFQVHIDENLPALLIGDSVRITQIMNNIMSNAFKYTESGMVELSLRGQPDKINKNRILLVISVKDTGIGMTPEQVSDLCSDYTRFHEREKRHISGTGLGMPIVYSLAGMMEAHIDIISEKDKGTTITISIPQETTCATSLGKETAKNLQQPGTSTRVISKRYNFTPEPMPYGKVLVVDDIEANLYVATGLLAFYELTVDTCESGFEALEKINQGNVYDIVFLDQMMPGIDGIETMLTMRSMGYTHPIVAFTANALIGQAEALIEKGFDGFISKPIQTVHLNTILTKYVRDKQPSEVIAVAKSSKSIPQPVSHIEDYQSDAALIEKLRNDFAKDQKNTFRDLTNALSCGDNKTSRLLIHTLKGMAGLIAENELAKVSVEVEYLLAEGEMPPAGLLLSLENELNRVLASIAKAKGTTFADDKDFDKIAAIALLDELKPLLEGKNADSLSFLPELSTLPQTAVLCKQIETFEFKTALSTLHTLRMIFDE